MVDEYTGNVQIDREVDSESGGNRWGSGEGRIVHVELLNEDGKSVKRVPSGASATVRLHYDIPDGIERPVFGLAVHTLDGTHVTGPNTRDADYIPDRLEGEGWMDFELDRLLLVPGTYDISCSLYDFAVMHCYDFRHKVMRFDVDRGSLRESYGVVSLGGRWRADGGQ